MSRFAPSTRAWLALAVLLVVAAAFLYHETRGTTLWFDEWIWALYRRGNGVDTFLRPHNQHLSLVPIAIYKVLFATAGLRDYVPYRVMVIGAHLVCVVLVFVYATRRVGGFLALLGASLILFLGPGWQDVLWPFQVAWLLSLAAGVGALLMLDRGDRAGDLGACALLALSLASSGLGLPIALGLVVDVVWGRRRRRDAWIVAAPLALYALWWLGYQQSHLVRHNVVAAPRFVADAAAGAISALTGLHGQTIPDSAAMLDWGRPLAIVAIVLVAWGLGRARPISARVATLVVIPLAFWILTALNRAEISPPFASRYLYVGALLLVLLAAELARGIVPSRRVELLLAVVVAAAVVSNVGAFRDGGRFLHSQAQLVQADLGALDVARPLAKNDLIATDFPGYPLVLVQAGPYFAAEREFGSPAATPRELAKEPEPARETADAQLVAIHRPSLRPAPGGLPLAGRPVVDSAAGGVLARRGPCLGFRSAGFTATGARRELQVTLPPAGVLVRANGGPATVSLRRFAAIFPKQPLGRLAPSSSAVLRVAPDLGVLPWHLRVAPTAGVTVCGVT